MFTPKNNKGDLSLPVKQKSVGLSMNPKMNMSMSPAEEITIKKPIFLQTVQSLNVKDLECNIQHLMGVFESILKKR